MLMGWGVAGESWLSVREGFKMGPFSYTPWCARGDTGPQLTLRFQGSLGVAHKAGELAEKYLKGAGSLREGGKQSNHKQRAKL